MSDNEKLGEAKAPKSPLSAEVKAEAVAAVAAGATMTEVGNNLGVAPQTVSRWVSASMGKVKSKAKARSKAKAKPKAKAKAKPKAMPESQPVQMEMDFGDSGAGEPTTAEQRLEMAREAAESMAVESAYCAIRFLVANARTQRGAEAIDHAYIGLQVAIGYDIMASQLADQSVD